MKVKITLGLSMLVASLFSVESALAAAKPITGVNCNGGFFVRTPDKHIHWIDEGTKKHTEVYSQKDNIYAMAQCGAGVITVFQRLEAGEESFSAYYSPNCKNIGSEVGKSVSIYQGKEKINRIESLDGELSIRLGNNTYLKGKTCASVTKES